MLRYPTAQEPAAVASAHSQCLYGTRMTSIPNRFLESNELEKTGALFAAEWILVALCEAEFRCLGRLQEAEAFPGRIAQARRIEGLLVCRSRSLEHTALVERRTLVLAGAARPYGQVFCQRRRW